jgi:hypothetical protein
MSMVQAETAETPPYANFWTDLANLNPLNGNFPDGLRPVPFSSRDNPCEQVIAIVSLSGNPDCSFANS